MNYKIFASHCIATTVAILASDADADQETDLMLTTVTPVTLRSVTPPIYPGYRESIYYPCSKASKTIRSPER